MDAFAEDAIQRSIIRTLSNYPNISAAMIGLYVRPYNRNWHMVLNAMVEEGKVIKTPVPNSYHGASRYALARTDAA